MILECRAILFDQDGTLLDSMASAQRAWSNWAAKVGLGSDFKIRESFHGKPPRDVVRMLLPHISEKEVDRHADEMRAQNATTLMTLSRFRAPTRFSTISRLINGR